MHQISESRWHSVRSRLFLAAVGVVIIGSLVAGLLVSHTFRKTTAVQELLDELKADAAHLQTEDARDALIRGVRRVGADREAAVQVLRLLKSRDGNGGRLELRAIGTLQKLGPEIIPVLIDALSDDRVAMAASVALAEYGSRSLPHLIKLLKSKNAERRVGAVCALYVFGHNDINIVEALPYLQLALRDGTDESLRSNAAAAIGLMGREAAPAVPELTHAMKDENNAVRVSAAIAICKVSPEKREHGIKSLSLLLKAPELAIRRAAANFFANSGPESEAAIPALIAALNDADMRVKGDAIAGLAEIGVASEEVVSAVAHQLVIAPIHGNRWRASYTLGTFGKHALSAKPELLQALNDPNEGVRNMAAEALRSVEPDQ